MFFLDNESDRAFTFGPLDGKGRTEFGKLIGIVDDDDDDDDCGKGFVIDEGVGIGCTVLSRNLFIELDV